MTPGIVPERGTILKDATDGYVGEVHDRFPSMNPHLHSVQLAHAGLPPRRVLVSRLVEPMPGEARRHRLERKGKILGCFGPAPMAAFLSPEPVRVG